MTGADHQPARAGKGGIIAFAIALAVALAAVGALVWLGLPKHWNGGLVVVLSIVLLLMGIPVGVAMLGAAVLGLWVLSGARVVRSTLERAAYDAAESCLTRLFQCSS